MELLPSSARVTPIASPEASSSSRARDEEAAEGATSRECPICLQEGTLLATDCQHSFCRGCLTRWVESQPGNAVVVPCPMCRQALPPSNIPEGVKPMGAPNTRAAVVVTQEPCTCRRIIKWLLIVNASTGMFVGGILFFIIGSPNIDGYGY